MSLEGSEFHALQTAHLAIDGHTTSIEQAFLRAGESLGRGLDTFDAMSRDLNAILDDLRNGGMASASAALGRLSVQLVDIGQRLPRDAAILQSLLVGDETITQHLDRLSENIRMMTIIARSARIEAVVFGANAGLDSFTKAMERLTQGVSETIGRSRDDHAKLSERLRRLGAAQANLDRDFRERLIGLATDLSDTFAQIADRQARGVDLMGMVATRSAAIAQNTGHALMALQSGDATRQRLEHISAALRFATDLTTGAHSGVVAVPEADRELTALVLCRLQAAQLRDLQADFAQDVSSIDALLASLLTGTADLVGDGQAVLGGAGRTSETFLAAFRTRLADAEELLKTCEQARGDVERATLDLRTRLSTLSDAMSELGATTMDLIMLGVNAGLKATRLGLSGRSLMVIADELKRLAGLIATDSAALVTLFSTVQQDSRGLDRDLQNTPRPVDAEIRSIGQGLEASDMRVADALQSLKVTARNFEADLAAARERFQLIATGNADLGDIADALGGPDGLPEGAAAIAGPYLEDLLQPAYTMAREREIHDELLGRSAAPSGSGAVPDFDVDSLLFDEAV